MRAGAQVIDGLLQLYADVHSRKQQDIVQAVRDLVGGGDPNQPRPTAG